LGFSQFIFHALALTDGTVFVEGLVYFQGKWILYYGTADSFVGVAVCEKK